MKKIVMLLALVGLSASLCASHYPDSVQQASREQERIRKGWNFEFAGGVALSQLAFQHWGQAATNDHISNRIGFPAWNANIGISYYFLPWFGLGTGAHFSTYLSNATIDNAWTYDLTDRYDDAYTQTITPTDLKEKQEVWLVEIPVALQFRAMPEGKKVGFTGTLGAKLGLPIMNRYALNQAASLTNTVYYPSYDLTINSEIPTVLENGYISPYSRSIPSYRMAKLNFGAYAEAGVLFQVHQRVDLGVKLFVNYFVNDLINSSVRTPLGFKNVIPAGEYDDTPLHQNDYSSILNTTAVSSVHPWSVGLKLSLQINASRTDAQLEYDRQKRKKQKKETTVDLDEGQADVTIEQPEEPQIDSAALWREHCEENTRMILFLANECGIDLVELGGGTRTPYYQPRKPDTVYIHDTVYINRSVELIETRSAAQLLEEELNRAVIFFDFDKSIPKLEPADILVRIAAILRNNPAQRIYVNGHACKTGTDSYNLRLAMRRAKAVAEELRKLGVKDEQMIIQSKGSKEAFRYNGMEHQLSKDRRVEIIPVGLEDHTTVAETRPAATADTRPAATRQQVVDTPQATVASTDDDHTEVVRAGSRLSQIARRHYGDPMYWVYIYEANRDVIANPQDIQPGTTLRIPDLKDITRGRTRDEVAREANAKAQQYKNTAK